MEADEIARRIRQIHDIETAMDESGEGRTPLTDALRNAIPYMTPEEIREAFYRTLDKVDELYGDRSGLEERLRKEREAHESEIANIKTAHKAELETKDRELAARDNEIASDKAEIADLKKRLAESEAAVRDANHKVASMNQDKFCGASKKGIDLNTQSKLFRWREDADFELGNNFAERAARPVALSRKTSLYNCSHHGAKARAILRSFIETCKLQGIGIVNYMTEYFNAVCGGRTDYENLLPATIWIAR